MKPIDSTQALCSTCLSRVSALIYQKDDHILLQKDCPKHGKEDILLSSDADWYHRTMTFHHNQSDKVSHDAQNENCPFECGYCTSHGQKMYLPVVPVTSFCNLNCPVCYTINENIDPYFMTREEFSDTLKQILAADPERQIINFTGGEPLTHPNLLDFAKMCQAVGIHRITISTNGLVFLKNEHLLSELTKLGARIVFSFNSFKPEPYQITSGVDLLEKKLAILQLLSKHKPSTTLLSVAAAGVNDNEIGDIVAYMLDTDFIVSSEIHTVTFTGQNTDRFDRSTRLTTSDVIANIEKTNPQITRDDFLPSPLAHPLCYSTCYLLKLQDGSNIPFTNFLSDKEAIRMLSKSLYIEPSQTVEEVLTDAMNNIWSREAPRKNDEQILLALKHLLLQMYPSRQIEFPAQHKVAENATKAIYIHSHMDADNFDLKRIRECCGAVPDGKGNHIPTCAYNIFYRGKDPRFCRPTEGM